MANRIIPLLLLSLAGHVTSMVSTGRTGHGLIGFGIEMYKPPCAHACRDSIKGTALNCSIINEDHAGHSGGHHGSSNIVTEPACYAADDIFLQSLAYCISRRCEDLPTWKLEKWWVMFVAGRLAMQPEPKESYQQALERVKETPTAVVVSGDSLNQTSVVSDEDYILNFNGDNGFETAEISHERFGIILLVTGFAIPIATSLLRFVPFPSRWTSLFNAYFITPPAIGSKHNAAILNFFHVPTRGQALFIAYLITINLVLTFIDLDGPSPDGWYETQHDQWFGYLSLRTGVLSFANLPLLILYSGRNNVLLWLTNWSHSTFLLIHRYIAWICTLQAVVHSAMLLQEYIKNGSHASESKLPYWIWGIVATLCLSIMIPLAAYPIRHRVYELFRVMHILLAIFVVVGCYYHIICRFQRQWGYETWIYIAIAVWSFDRVMRVARLLRSGVKTARITRIDEDYVRVEIDGVADSGHAYLYFPTLTWRVWENHPFSVASTVLSPPRSHLTQKHGDADVEKLGVSTTVTDDKSETSSSTITPTKIGLTFLLRLRGGVTSKIASRETIPVLVESGYGPHQDLSSYPSLLCIAGGVGITACIPYLRSHPGRTKLLWGVRTPGIVEDLASTLQDVDKEVWVGKRMDVGKVLEREVVKSESTVVVSSGPHGMADEVRVAVSEMGRRGYDVRLVEEAFSW